MSHGLLRALFSLERNRVSTTWESWEIVGQGLESAGVHSSRIGMEVWMHSARLCEGHQGDQEVHRQCRGRDEQIQGDPGQQEHCGK